MPILRLDIWSDLACPWCYVGKRRLERALAQFEHAADVQIRWRSYELDAAAPPQRDGAYVEHLSRKYRMPVEKGEAMLRTMTETAAAEGITMRFDQLRAGNTFDGHRLLQLAGERNLQGALKERLVRAYFSEGALMSDRETLVRLGAEVGLDAQECRAVLASERYGEDVRADEKLAKELEINGVPFFVMGEGEVAVYGAQPAEEMLAALREAWTAITAAKPGDEAANDAASEAASEAANDAASAAASPGGETCSVDGEGERC